MPESEQVTGVTPDPPKTEPEIHVTPKAIDKIRHAFASEGVSGALRLGVLGGGCSGLSYQFKFDKRQRPNEKRFYSLSRKFHPDLYTLKSPEEQQYALEATAILNDAYRTLRDPLTRAEYLLKENGFDIGEQGSKNVPPELLEEVFELNMALEELRGGDEEARTALAEAQKKFAGMRDDIDQELETR